MTKDVSLTERRKGQIEGNQYSVHDKEPLCDQLFNFESLLHLDPPRQAGSNHSKQILICILIRDESNDSLCMLMVVFMIMLIQKIHQKNLTIGLLHLSVSSYEEGYLTTYYFFICSHTFNISSTIFVVCYISCNLRTFFLLILEW